MSGPSGNKDLVDKVSPVQGGPPPKRRLLLGAEGDDPREPREPISPVPKALVQGPGGPAADLSGGLFSVFCGLSLEGRGFGSLQVLSVASTQLRAEDVAQVLTECRLLQKLDASRCGLLQLPGSHLWAALEHLEALLLDRNHLGRWEDVECATSPPALKWLTFFDNPIASQPEFRRFTLERKPQLLAVDSWMVSDGERLGHATRVGGRATGATGAVLRFAPGGASLSAALGGRQWVHGAKAGMSQAAWQLLQSHKEEMRTLQHLANRCSAACCVQTNCRGYLARKYVNAKKALLLRATRLLQNRIRLYLWKRRMTLYIKDYLSTIDELDLLLSAREMLKQRALREIKGSLLAFIHKRRAARSSRKAADLITRVVRGHLTRQRVLRQLRELEQYNSIYFLERHAWEFTVLANVVLRRHRLPPLAADTVYEVTNVLGIRIPDTDEVIRQSAPLVAVRRLECACILRPRRCGRFPQHPWDGPFHRLVGKADNERIDRAWSKVRRRGVSVNTRCREAFRGSCVPGQQPIDVPVPSSEDTFPLEYRTLEALLNAPLGEWPEQARNADSMLGTFLREAQRVGVRQKERLTEGGTVGSEVDSKTGLPSYSRTRWLGQRLLCYRCPSPQVAASLLVLLVRQGRTPVKLVGVETVSFLTEKGAREIAAAGVIQATYRAHRTRMQLLCSLRAAVVMRRAAVCIQRAWRWGLVGRRLEILAGAYRCAQGVRSSSLFLEERLFLALNSIAATDRYPPMLKERNLGFGWSGETEAVVLVHNGVRRCSKAQVAEHKTPQQQQLPGWLMAPLGEMKYVSQGDKSLRHLTGLQGLLLEGLGERTEDHVVTVQVPSLPFLAQERHSSCDLAGSQALVACSGSLRFIEFRFQSVAQARQRALAIFLCTYNAKHHAAVQLLARPMLQDTHVAWNILRLWDLYGLVWPAGSKVALFHLRQREMRMVEVIPLCGHEPLSLSARRPEWLGDGEDQTLMYWGDRNRGQAEAALLHKYESLRQQVVTRRERECEELEQRLAGHDAEELQRVLADGSHEDGVCVNGALPPTTPRRCMQPTGAVIRAERASHQSTLAAAQEAEAAGKRASCQQVAVWKSQGRRGLEFEDRLMQFYASCEEAERSHVEERVPGILTRAQPEQLAAAAACRARKAAESSHRAHMIELAHKEKEQTEEELQARAWSEEDLLQDRRERIRAQKAAKAARKEAKMALSEHLSKRSQIERICRVASTWEAQEEQQAKVASRINSLKARWAQRTKSLAQRHHSCQEQRDRQVQDLRLHLESLAEAREERDLQELQEKRLQVADQKSFDRLVHAAREQLSRCIMPGASKLVAAAGGLEQAGGDLSGDLGTTKPGKPNKPALMGPFGPLGDPYEAALQAVRDLAEAVVGATLEEPEGHDEHAAAKTIGHSGVPRLPPIAAGVAAAETSIEGPISAAKLPPWAPPAPPAPPAWPQRPTQPTMRGSPRPPPSMAAGMHVKPPSAGSSRSVAEPWLRRFGGSLPLSAR